MENGRHLRRLSQLFRSPKPKPLLLYQVNTCREDPSLPMKSVNIDPTLQSAPYKVFLNTSAIGEYGKYLGIDEKTLAEVDFTVAKKSPYKQDYTSQGIQTVRGTWFSTNKIVIYSNPFYREYRKSVRIADKLAVLEDSPVDKAKAFLLEKQLAMNASLRTKRLPAYLRAAPPERGRRVAKEIFFTKMQRDFTNTIKHELVHVKQHENGKEYHRERADVIFQKVKPYAAKVSTVVFGGAATAYFNYHGVSFDNLLFSFLVGTNSYFFSDKAVQLVGQTLYERRTVEKEAEEVLKTSQNELSSQYLGWVVPNEIADQLTAMYEEQKVCTEKQSIRLKAVIERAEKTQ